MAAVEFPQRPIYGSERILRDQRYSERTLAMYKLVINNFLGGAVPTKRTVLNLNDPFGRLWIIDVLPERSGLYARRYIGESNTQGFRTDPYNKSGREDKYYIEFWRSNKTRKPNAINSEWMLQESEAVLQELILTNTTTTSA